MEDLDYRLKLKSKRLGSGRFQVNFSTHGFSQECYGYLLAEPKTSLREVVEKISRHIGAMQFSDRYYQRNLFSLKNREMNSGRILVFKTVSLNS
jgi:hypothetical protein